MPASDEVFDPTVMIFAALAVFVLWKLRSVLGKRVDREGPTPGRFPPTGAPRAALRRRASRRFRARPRPCAPIAGRAWPKRVARLGLASTPSRRRTPFSGKSFVDGARRAYELIVTAFAKGDRDTLKPLLSQDVFDGFSAEIARREQQGESMETAVVAIDSAGRRRPRAAAVEQVTVRFTAS